MRLINNVKGKLQKLRDSGWEVLLEDVKKFCNTHSIEIIDMANTINSQLETYTDDVRSDERFEGILDLGDLAKKMIETMKNHVFPLVYRMIELALLLPVATAIVERVFSVLNIVKTDLRKKDWI
ncbi:uncharacterized protein LOC122014082 [Zingiber officinale]|uniref:uncharacterized protein LOC122014082 n=1 Tax=Zingiber officinale TaxID=94328 RepID=UPI001C4BDE47|nr:uncharacterized protein LOC122014082 [Zingiber officinale]